MTSPGGSRARPTVLLRASLALHAAAIPAVAILPDRWPWIVGTVFADHLALVGAGLLPRCRLLGPNLRHDRAAAAMGGVAVTFDDGPDPEVTPAVLEILDRFGAKASFFGIGARVEAHRDLAAEIARRGHSLENHSQSHANAFFFHTPQRLEREVAGCQEAVWRATGTTPHFFRAPAGIRSPLLQGTLDRHGLRLASWTRRGFDTVSQDAVAVARRLTRGLAAGDVLLLHDGWKRGRPPVVLEVLPRVLESLAKSGLSAVTLTPVSSTPNP